MVGGCDSLNRDYNETRNRGEIVEARSPPPQGGHKSNSMSHVEMGVSPSGQDDAQMEQFCKMYAGDQSAWIRGILNKKGDAEFTVYFQCGKSWKPIKDVPWEVIPDTENERFKFWKTIVDQRVKGFTTPAPAATSYAGGAYQYPGARDRRQDVQVPQRTGGRGGRRKDWWL